MRCHGRLGGAFRRVNQEPLSSRLVSSVSCQLCAVILLASTLIPGQASDSTVTNPRKALMNVEAPPSPFKIEAEPSANLTTAGDFLSMSLADTLEAGKASLDHKGSTLVIGMAAILCFVGVVVLCWRRCCSARGAQREAYHALPQMSETGRATQALPLEGLRRFVQVAWAHLSHLDACDKLMVALTLDVGLFYVDMISDVNAIWTMILAGHVMYAFVNIAAIFVSPVLVAAAVVV